MKIIFECLYIGLFPLAFLLMLTPLGVRVFINYFGGILWIQSWPPLFAVLNNMMTNETAKQLQSETLGQDGISLISQVGISAIEADISAMAGYLSMSIPFIAIGIVYGVSRFAGLATSMLAVSQSGATQAAEESTVGNLSIANTNLDNHSFNNMQGHQHNTSGRIDSGSMSVVGGSGYQTTVNSDGSVIMDSSGAVSNLPMSMNIANNLSSSLSKSASHNQSIGEGISSRATDIFSHQVNEAKDMANYIDKQFAVDENKSFSENSSVRNSYSNLQNRINNVSQQTGLDRGMVFAAGVAGKAGFEFLGNGGGASLSVDGNIVSKEQFTKALSMMNDERTQKDLDTVLSTVSASSTRHQDTEGKNFRESFNTAINKANSLQNEANIYFQKSEQYSEAANSVENQSIGMNQNLTQQFVEHLAEEKDRFGNTLGMHGAANLLRSSKDHEQELLDHYKSSFIEQYKEDYLKSFNKSENLSQNYSQRVDTFQQKNKLQSNSDYENNKNDWNMPSSFGTEYKVDSQHTVNNALITTDSNKIINEEKQRNIEQKANILPPLEWIKNTNDDESKSNISEQRTNDLSDNILNKK